ncbi:hypothetical protein BDA99DRAFT_528397 [Phascolomyces articulosus]|uniref:Secreted protein n=1 Tax=Phascolomyces articulosus TaxID=60185 RepID=A0AAD5P7L8_9FUNG|nr:hypothetical protein BDA99DRAFT_528397 [Phascolomyces articulosus]
MNICLIWLFICNISSIRNQDVWFACFFIHFDTFPLCFEIEFFSFTTTGFASQKKLSAFEQIEMKMTHRYSSYSIPPDSPKKW